MTMLPGTVLVAETLVLLEPDCLELQDGMTTAGALTAGSLPVLGFTGAGTPPMPAGGVAR